MEVLRSILHIIVKVDNAFKRNIHEKYTSIIRLESLYLIYLNYLNLTVVYRTK